MRGDDFYAVLGLRPGAARAEIDQAYRRLIKRYHPDYAGGDAGRAAEINRAYSELRARGRQPQRPHPAPPAAVRPPQLRARPGSSWLGPAVVLAAFAAALLLAQSAAMMETGPSWPQYPSAGGAAAESRAARPATLAFSLDDPLSTELIEQSIADALRMDAAENPALAAEFSRECLSRLSSNPSLPLFDSCAAYDEAVAILAADNPAFDSGPFNPSAVTARQVGAARLMSADYLESESRLQQIRSRVHLILLPKIPDFGRVSDRSAIATLPAPEIPRAPVIAQAIEPRTEPNPSFRRSSGALQPQEHARPVASARQQRARSIASGPQELARPVATAQRRRATPVQRAASVQRAARTPAAEPRKVPAWQRPIKPAWQRPLRGSTPAS